VEGRVAGDVQGGKGVRMDLEDSDDDGEVVGVDCAAEAEGGRRCGAAAGSWSCWDGAFGAPFRGMEIVSTPPRIRNVASNGNDDHVDRREQAV